MNRPLEIRDVENISLEASDDNSDMYPQLMAQFTSQYVRISDCISFKHINRNVVACRSVVWMINVTHAAIDGISVTVTTPHVSGVILQQCSHLYIKSSTYVGIKEQDNEYGIIAYESSDIEMDSLEASNFTYGVMLYKSRSTSMMNISAAHNEGDGIYLHHSTNTSMLNVSVVHIEGHGIYLYNSTDTSMMNVSAVHNGHGGIRLRRSTNTSMMNVSVVHNEGHGIYLYNSNDTSMMNVSAAHNRHGGIRLRRSTNTSMMNVSVVHIKGHGIYLEKSTDTSMMNVSAVHNGQGGIRLRRCTNTSMMNVSVVHNRHGGIWLRRSNNTSMMNVFAAHNQKKAIIMYLCINTSLYYSYTYHNGDGMYITESRTSRKNRNTIHIIKSTDTHILNSELSEHSEIEMRNTVNTYITNTTSLITAYNTTNVVLNGTSFSNMDAPSTASSASEPTSLPAVISLYSSTLIIADCNFIRNNISSIKTIDSKVTMSGKVLFHNNTASLGTVLISAKKSLLIITEYSNIEFQNNYAINYGGVFYITSEESYQPSMSPHDIIQSSQRNIFGNQEVDSSLIISRTECFLRVEGSRSHARLTFINNTAGKGGDVLYGGLVALGYDGDWNCLLSFKNISDMSQQSGLSLISSAPSRVCLCNEAGQPDCLTVADLTTHVIYPGQTITIPAVIVGQDFGTVNGSVFAQFHHTPYTTDLVDMEPRHSIAVEHSQCSNLEYTIFSKSEESAAVLVLTHDSREISHLMNEEDNQEITNSWEVLNKELNYKTLAQDIICDFINFTHWPWQYTIESKQFDNRTVEDFYKFTIAPINSFNHYCRSEFIQTKFVFPKEIYRHPLYINISFHLCPPGFSLSKDPPFRCDCNQLMKQLPGVKCHIQDQAISRSGLVWISTDGNETVAASNCPYNYCNREEINVTLEDPDSQCNFNHLGTLCGGCQPGLSIALGTNQCVQCPNTHLALLLPFALTGAVLVCFIKVIDLTISQGTLNGLVFYANIVKANEYLLYNEKQTNPLPVFIAWLNLDLGIETCFFNGLTAYGKTWLQFVFPFYIWSIAGLIIILAKYSDRVAKVMGNNSVPVLATLFLLSYAKLFRTIITALSFTTLSTTHGSKAVWSADGNLDYLGPEHAPLFVVAVAILLFLWLPYTLLLFLGQWLHRCNCRLITRMMMKIKPFLDAHYGPLKGNHRYWFGALLLVRAVILLISALVPANRANITVYSITVCALVLMIGFAVGVYRSFAVATFDAIWFVNLGLLSASHMFTTLEGGHISLASNYLFGLAFAQFIGLIFFKVLVIIKRSERVMACLRRGQPEYDDWEVYEQAALQREMESDSEREESEESGSIESLPTYGY